MTTKNSIFNESNKPILQSNFHTKNIEIEKMFNNNYEINSLGVTNFDTSKVSNIAYNWNITKLKKPFNINILANMEYMLCLITIVMKLLY